MFAWQLLTTPHVMTALAVTVETIVALAQLAVLAYWVRRWEKNNAEWDRRFEETKRKNREVAVGLQATLAHFKEATPPQSEN